MLKSTTEPVQIVGYAQMGADRAEGGFTYKDGTPVEEVIYLAPDESANRTVKLDRSVNGQRPEAGSRASIEIVSEIVADAKIGRDGRPFPTTKEKRSAIGFVPVPVKG